MDDLITRLTAAIDQVERVARRAAESVNRNNADGRTEPAGSEWTADGGLVFGEHEALWDCEGSSTLCMAVEAGEHVALNDPAKVLRGCAADRKILALHQPIETFAGMTEFLPKHAGTPGFPIRTICELCADHDSENGWDDYGEDIRYPCATLRAVAERYGLEADGG